MNIKKEFEKAHNKGIIHSYISIEDAEMGYIAGAKMVLEHIERFPASDVFTLRDCVYKILIKLNESKK